MVLVTEEDPVEVANKLDLENVWAVLKWKLPYERLASLDCHATTFFIIDPKTMEIETTFCEEPRDLFADKAVTDVLSRNQ